VETKTPDSRVLLKHAARARVVGTRPDSWTGQVGLATAPCHFPGASLLLLGSPSASQGHREGLAFGCFRIKPLVLRFPPTALRLIFDSARNRISVHLLGSLADFWLQVDPRLDDPVSRLRSHHQQQSV
jgi:hypothetical protein